jgi:hypothetical protein
MGTLGEYTGNGTITSLKEEFHYLDRFFYELVLTKIFGLVVIPIGLRMIASYFLL